MKKHERLILIGSTGRNCGKTFLARELLRRLKGTRVAALKVTGMDRRHGVCQRGGEGCGACRIDGDFCLDEERSRTGGKDTAMLLAAGAERVFWLRCLRSALPEGFAAFLRAIGDPDTGASDTGAPELIIAESNSLREVVRPAMFIMVRGADGSVKPSAAAVESKADIVLQSPFSAESIDRLAEALAKKGIISTEKRSNYGTNIA